VKVTGTGEFEPSSLDLIEAIEFGQHGGRKLLPRCRTTPRRPTRAFANSSSAQSDFIIL
jgi:hypothetical protein